MRLRRPLVATPTRIAIQRSSISRGCLRAKPGIMRICQQSSMNYMTIRMRRSSATLLTRILRAHAFAS